MKVEYVAVTSCLSLFLWLAAVPTNVTLLSMLLSDWPINTRQCHQNLKPCLTKSKSLGKLVVKRGLLYNSVQLFYQKSQKKPEKCQEPTKGHSFDMWCLWALAEGSMFCTNSSLGHVFNHFLASWTSLAILFNHFLASWTSLATVFVNILIVTTFCHSQVYDPTFAFGWVNIEIKSHSWLNWNQVFLQPFLLENYFKRGRGST